MNRTPFLLTEELSFPSLPLPAGAHIDSMPSPNGDPVVPFDSQVGVPNNPDPPKSLPTIDSRSMLIFSGGSAANNFVSMLQSITDNICYVLPVSDDGGSTSEIVKIVGGPGIGDIRSRLVRLAETKTVEAKAVHKLLSYRLPTDPGTSPTAPSPAKIEWLNIVEGNHHLWKNISVPYRESMRAFLLQFHYQILKQAGQGPAFDFRGGSLGNFFLTGCRLFFDSLEAAIFQFARITRSSSRTEVLPIIATNKNPVAIAASLRNGSVVVGQCEISHPGVVTPQLLGQGLLPTLADFNFQPSTQSTPVLSRRSPGNMLKQQLLKKNIEPAALANTPRSGLHSLAGSRTSSTSNLVFSKAADSTPALPSPIRRIFYVNPERAETFPDLNTLLPWHLVKKRTVIYMIGSLYTSIIPCLIVPGVGRLLVDCDDEKPESPVHQRRNSDSPIVVPQRNPSLRRKSMISTSTSTSTTGLPPLSPSPNSSPVREKSSLSNVSIFGETSVSTGASAEPKVVFTTDEEDEDDPALIDSFAHAEPGRSKVLLLNGTYDRETAGYTALDFILAITDALNYSCLAEESGDDAVRKVATRDVIQDMNEAVHVSWDERERDEDPVVKVDSPKVFTYIPPQLSSSPPKSPFIKPSGEMESSPGRGYLVTPFPPSTYITHLVYPSDGEIPVDEEAISGLGIRCIRADTSPVETHGMSNHSSISHSRGHYGVDELRRVLEPLIL